MKAPIDIASAKLKRDPQVDKWIDELLAQNRIILEGNAEVLKMLTHPPLIYWTGDKKP